MPSANRVRGICAALHRLFQNLLIAFRIAGARCAHFGPVISPARAVALQTPHQETGAPTSELERSQHNPGLRKGDEQAQPLASYVTLVSRTECWQDFALPNRTTVTRRVDSARCKPACCVRADRFFDGTLGTVVLEARPRRSHLHAQVRAAPVPWRHDASGIGSTTCRSETDNERECAGGFSHADRCARISPAVRSDSAMRIRIPRRGRPGTFVGRAVARDAGPEPEVLPAEERAELPL